MRTKAAIDTQVLKEHLPLILTLAATGAAGGGAAGGLTGDPERRKRRALAGAGIGALGGAGAGALYALAGGAGGDQGAPLPGMPPPFKGDDAPGMSPAPTAVRHPSHTGKVIGGAGGAVGGATLRGSISAAEEARANANKLNSRYNVVRMMHEGYLKEQAQLERELGRARAQEAPLADILERMETQKKLVSNMRSTRVGAYDELRRAEQAANRPRWLRGMRGGLGGLLAGLSIGHVADELVEGLRSGQ